MEVHVSPWSSFNPGAMTTTSGDSGAPEPQGQPRHASQSLDQQAADILKLFGHDMDDSCTSIMDFDTFGFDDAVPESAHDETTVDSTEAVPTTTGTESPASIYESGGNTHVFEPWSSAAGPLAFGYEQTAFQPGSWIPDPAFRQPIDFGFTGGRGLGIHIPPTSNPVEVPSNMSSSGGYVDRHSPTSQNDGYYRQTFPLAWHASGQAQTPQEEQYSDEREEDGTDSADPCYAQLLYNCLKEAPQHTLALRELYEWVSQHSQKAKDPGNRGWQNSVRHNLSMNAAFQRVTERTSSGKKGSLWRLTEEALRDGVISTTRYRKDPKRKPERRSNPATNRQVSGAKGGRATRDASRMRQQQQQQQQQHQQHRYHGLPTTRHFHRPPRHGNSPQYSPYSVHSTPHSPQPFPPPTRPPYTMPTSAPASPYFTIVPPDQHSHELTPLGFPVPDYPSSPDDAFALSVQQQHQHPQHHLFHYHHGPHGHGHHHHHQDLTKPSSAAPHFDLLALDCAQAPLFADHDPELGAPGPDTPTPSLMTEASFMTDENVPALVSCGTSRENTIFEMMGGCVSPGELGRGGMRGGRGNDGGVAVLGEGGDLC